MQNLDHNKIKMGHYMPILLVTDVYSLLLVEVL